MMSFKKLLICFVSLFAASAVIYLLACSWPADPDEDYISYFRQDIPEKNNYFYSYFNFYDEYSGAETDKEQNIGEWKKHLGGKVSEEDIENLLYKIPLHDLQEIYRKAVARQWTKIDGEWAKNGMMQRIIRLRDLNTLNYLFYAKSCEPHAVRNAGSWNYSPPDTEILDSLIVRGLELYKTSRPEFTRLRYAFQMVRLAYYADRPEDCTEYYREMIELEVKSRALAKMWALSFYAGSVESPVEAAYYYSRVFDRCPRYSHQAMTSFRWLVGSIDTAWVSALCENGYEKAVVHAMTGFTCFHPTLEPIKHVHDLCPAIPYIETLLIREINKVEDGLSAPSFFGKRQDHPEAILYHARELKDLSIRYAGLREVQHPALWYTAAAYLAHLLGEQEQAALLIDIATREEPDTKVSEQLSAIRLLVETSAPVFDENTEERILPAIRWLLDKHRETKESGEGYDFFDRTLAHYFADKLTAIYLAGGQPVKAALCTGIAEYYSGFPAEGIYGMSAFSLLDGFASVAQLEDMLEKIRHPGAIPDAYERFLYGQNRFEDYTLLELIGTKHLRALHFQDAASCFEQLSGGSELFHLEYDPFLDPPVTDSYNYGTEESLFNSKLSFAREMADLENRIHPAEKPIPADLYRYANGLYQMTWYGNSWNLLSYRWTCMDACRWKDTTPDSECYYYYRTDVAREYYMKAFEASRDKEFKARCLFMASHCYQMNVSDVYLPENGKYHLGAYFSDNPYFTLLHKKYRKTDFYKDALTRCTYLSDFLSNK